MAKPPKIIQRLRRTPYQTIAAIFMIFVTLFVSGFFLILAAFSSGLLQYFETKPQLTVFLKDDKDKASIDSLVDKLKTTGKVATHNYISKEQALSIYKEQNKDDPLLLEMVTADILPASLEITANSPKYLSELSELIKNEPGIDKADVVFQKDVVDALISWTSTIRKIGLIFILFLSFATFLILLTSIGLKIALKKDEIEILRLVGATSWYIKKPFIFEGVIYGIIGAGMSWLVITLVLMYANPFISSFFQGIPRLPLISMNNLSIDIYPLGFLLYLLLFAILTTVGAIIGFLGSFFAVNRYLER